MFFLSFDFRKNAFTCNNNNQQIHYQNHNISFKELDKSSWIRTVYSVSNRIKRVRVPLLLSFSWNKLPLENNEHFSCYVNSSTFVENSIQSKNPNKTTLNKKLKHIWNHSLVTHLFRHHCSSYILMFHYNSYVGLCSM